MSAERLARLEALIDTAGVAEQIETLLPIGVRPRQLRVRTLLLGMLLLAADQRPMFVLNIHRALIALSPSDQQRLGIITAWNTGPHLLTYRQVERTFTLITVALSKDTPDGTPSELLSHILDRLLEASVQACGAPASGGYAVDWTDLETWARPPHGKQPSIDPDAAFGHRNTNHPARNERFFGYYLQALTTVPDEHGPPVPELVRRLHITGCQHDPPQQIVPVIERMHHNGIPITDLLADSGYSYRKPEHWALPIRRLQINLTVDLHPNDRGPKGTHAGAIITNGRLYCPATPAALLGLSPLAPGADEQQTNRHDQQSRELARYKLAAHTAPDADGYHRVSCPATHGKVRCPLRPESMMLSHDHPTVPGAPEHPPLCCTQKTITVPASITAKTAQRHDYPSPEHRVSYHRRSAAERVNASVKDPAQGNIQRGFCRLTDLPGIALATTAVAITRNLRTTDAFEQRHRDNPTRAGNNHTTRRRRRHQTITQLITAGSPP